MSRMRYGNVSFPREKEFVVEKEKRTGNEQAKERERVRVCIFVSFCAVLYRLSTFAEDLDS